MDGREPVFEQVVMGVEPPDHEQGSEEGDGIEEAIGNLNSMNSKYTINNLRQDLEEMEHEQYFDLGVEQGWKPNFEAI